MSEVLVLHGGEALWVVFYPGLLIFGGLLVAGAALIRRGLASSHRTSLMADLDRDPPARSAWRLGTGGFLVLLALLFLGWCHHIGFLAS